MLSQPQLMARLCPFRTCTSNHFLQLARTFSPWAVRVPHLLHMQVLCWRCDLRQVHMHVAPTCCSQRRRTRSGPFPSSQVQLSLSNSFLHSFLNMLLHSL